MIVSTLRRGTAFRKYPRKYCSKTPLSCRSFEEVYLRSYREDVRLRIHTDSKTFDYDENGVDKRQKGYPSANFCFAGNATDIANKDGDTNDNKEVSEECILTLGIDKLLDIHGNHEDDGICHCTRYIGDEDRNFCSQIEEGDEQMECSSLSGICKRGEGPFDVHDGFRKFFSSASGHIRQLDMAVNALLRLHTPQPSNTYFSILQACNKFKGLIQARRVHAHIISYGGILTSFLGDYLVMTLAKCGAVDDARRLYITLPHRTIISCTALMSAYVDCGQAQEALKMYYIMQEDVMEPDSYTFVTLLKVHESMQDLKAGNCTHIYACKKGLTSISHVCNSLIGLYGKCGALAEAENLFCFQSKSNIVSWTIMLSIYCEQGQAGKALWIYRQMHEEGLSPDQFAYVVVLQACGIIAEQEQDLAMGGHTLSSISVEVVQALHADALRNDYAFDVFVGTALLTAYGKCGALLQPEHVFNLLMERNLVTWNAMMSVYMDKGEEEKALLLYTKMQREDVKPEQMTFVITFQACGNLAEKDMASSPVGSSSKEMYLQILHALHVDFCIAERLQSMVAVTALLRSYGKCGAILEAEDIFNTLLHPDLVSCNAMLISYFEQGEGEKSLCLYVHMQEEHIAMDDVTMINMLLACSEAGNVEVCKHIHFGAVSTNFDWSLPVAATLIHAYGNCSMVIDAQVCFHGIAEPDAVSWNACIADHAGDGAFCMFENLRLAGMRADEVAFSSLLAACMHSGLVTVGLECFYSMRTDFGLTSDVQHYSILVDLFSRAGDFKRIENILEGLQEQSNVKTWLFLMGACRTHNNIELAKQAFNYALGLQPKLAIPYVLMSNIYATAELQLDG